ncbi:nucleoside kinase, partial [candidate division KSB1 bacterium]|nr:nucleoside kinase [candidate division KSB1 bacterium]
MSQWQAKFQSGATRTFSGSILLLDILKQVKPDIPHAIVLAKVNNHIRSLREEISDNAAIEWISINALEGRRSYQLTLCLVLVRAFEELYPKKQLIIDHSLGKGLYCQMKGEESFSQAMLRELKLHMVETIGQDDPIEPDEKLSDTTSEKEAFGLKPLATMYPYRCGKTTTCMGYPLLPSAGWLKTFDLVLWAPGMILRLPDEDNINVLPPYQEQKKLFQVFHEYGQWVEILGIEHPDELNRAIETGEISELIKIAEGLHEKKIASIADEIAKRKHDTRIVLIAGPSSSGKTSFIKRLTIQLRVNGLRPLTMSLDDYFLDRERTPMDSEGNP